MDFVPALPTLVTYTLTCLVLFTPGPDMSLFLAKTLAGGRQAGFASMLGSNVGCLFHTTLAALGLSALIASSVTAFTVIKVVGALYLLWMAVDAVRHGARLSLDAQRQGALPFWRTFLLGIGVNLTNPKIVLFFVTFLPQFVSASDPHVAGRLMFLGLYFVAISVPLGFLMVIGAERLIGTLRARPGIIRGIDYAFAGVFSAFAMTILGGTVEVTGDAGRAVPLSRPTISQ